MSGEQDQVVGRAKEVQGKLTGDDEREAEGKGQRAAGKVEHALGEAADKVKGAAEGVKSGLDRK
ncbi:MAG TPA: CsbD family protein [Candidatus Acidoferrales bacterium]|nr:CsbD family protein [Candidatus Acidoferrales bacterium]